MVQLLGGSQLSYHGSIIFAEAAVIESRRQMFRSAAGSLIHSNDVKSGLIGFGGDSVHVMRITAAFESMQQHHGLSSPPILLPVTISQKLCVGSRGKDTALNCDSRQEASTRPVVRHNSHEMLITKERVGNEGRKRYHLSILTKKAVVPTMNDGLLDECGSPGRTRTCDQP